MQELKSVPVRENLMLNRLDIRGYRGLKELTLANAGRINLIVGRNDTGKTSLLEAIRFLLSGDPRYLRRGTRNRLERRPVNLEQSYRLAFFDSQDESPLTIEGAFGDLHLSAHVTIRTVPNQLSQPVNLEDDDEDDETIESLLSPDFEIVVHIETNTGAAATIRQPLRERESLSARSQRKFSGTDFPKVPSLVWLGTNRAEAWAHARRYSHLYRTGGDSLLLDILRAIEPNLKSLVVLTTQDDRFAYSPVLEVDLGLDHLLPLESMGDGFGSTISIISAIGAAENGICLIDEVDNGIHYSLLPQMWRSAFDATTKYNAQIWATTHSYDCVNAIYDAMSDAPDALRVLRLERKQDGLVVVHTFDYAMLGRALERGLEVR